MKGLVVLYLVHHSKQSVTNSMYCQMSLAFMPMRLTARASRDAKEPEKNLKMPWTTAKLTRDERWIRYLLECPVSLANRRRCFEQQ
jgi:hypothetical protein